MSALETLDSALSDFFAQWDGYSTALATAVVLLVTYRIMSSQEPDAHPLLLARQALPSAVRQEGESAVYRGQSAPHGMPLNAGLNVKDAGAPKWSRGRDGDLRDIWRKVVAGGEGGAKGRLLTVLGSENVVEHQQEDITKQINALGKYVEAQGSIKVAIYLPNSIELLVALLACSFYPNLTAVLIPFDVPESQLISMLKRSAVDTVVTATGSFPLDSVVKAHSSLRHLIWVVDEGSRHMDWNDVPAGMGSSVNVTTWQDLLNEAPVAAAELPSGDADNAPQDVVTFWPLKSDSLEDMVRFTQANLVSGVSGQIAGLPSKARLGPSDLFLPADSLTNIHTLTLTLAALYSNTSVAFNSVAGRSPDLAVATQGIAPTVVVASPTTLLQTHSECMRRLGGLGKLSHNLSTSTMTQRGVQSASNFLSTFAGGARPSLGNKPGKLRLIYTAERLGTGSPVVSSQIQADLRVMTGARVVYALSAARVAGAVAQTGLYDYRVDSTVKSHFGVPLSSVEIYLKDSGAHKTTDDTQEGEIVARGPCVSGGEARLGVAGKLNHDNTLSYV